MLFCLVPRREGSPSWGSGVKAVPARRWPVATPACSVLAGAHSGAGTRRGEQQILYFLKSWVPMIMLDSSPARLVKEVIKRSLLTEKGRRHPLHGIHRWWSRRFSTLYRFILGAYLYEREEDVMKVMDKPELMRGNSSGKNFYEPFMGGGTGVIEAAYAGWNVIGVDINPIPVKFVRAALRAIKREIDTSEYLNVARKVVEMTESETRELWEYDGGLITYLFISRGRVAPWLAKRKEKNVLFCPKCQRIFEKRENPTTCPYCGREIYVTQKPIANVDKSLPLVREGWYVFAVERRNGNTREYISVAEDKELRKWLEKSAKIAKEKAKKLQEILHKKIDVAEGTRLKREASILTYDSLFTWRQLATYWSWIQNTLKIKNRLFREFLLIAMSESFKGASIVVKWHPPINEPVPAGGIKTYWVPHYTVEVNPIARKKELIPAVRNGIVSALRKQKRFFSFLQKTQPPSFDYQIYNKNCIEFNPGKIDLAFIDPPYLDSVKSYASLSLIHHSTIIIEQKLMKKGENILLGDIERKEIPRNPAGYQKSIERLLLLIRNSLAPRGRVVFVFNRKKKDDWRIIFAAIKNSNLFPIAAYWTLGETPGGLARSTLRGLIVLVLSPHKSNDFHTVLSDALEEAGDAINQKVETQAINAMLYAYRTIFNNSTK